MVASVCVCVCRSSLIIMNNIIDSSFKVADKFINIFYGDKPKPSNYVSPHKSFNDIMLHYVLKIEHQY